jgi:voltage-gated potassium channel
MKQKIYNLVEKGSNGSRLNLIFDYFIIILIIINVLAVALDTLNNLSGQLRITIKVIENLSIIIFSIEFLLRVYISDLTHPADNKLKSILKFVGSPFGLIDLLAILPFYIPFIIATDLRFLRILRLIRFFRVLKISRYNSTLKLIKDVFKEKKSEIGMTFFIAILLLLISGFAIYSVENSVQPDKFPNVFASLWWVIATLTNIGITDSYPLTITGKIIAGMVAILGIGLIALPTGIISAGFIEKISIPKSTKKIDKCPHCGCDL